MFWTLILALLPATAKIELAEPFIVHSGGQPIKVDVGHASPTWADFDGDGLPDLLVGQFGNGRMRVYRNVGTRAEPKFDGFEWFHADGKIAEIEAG
jgi:hypothetical protein